MVVYLLLNFMILNDQNLVNFCLCFLGYSLNSKAYRFFDLYNKTIIESIDAIFHEKKNSF